MFQLNPGGTVANKKAGQASKSKSVSPITIERVETKADWDRFIGFAWDIYAGYPAWVPPLRIAVRDLLDVTKNPFFKHAAMHPVVATRDGRIVGRIIAIVDDAHNRFHREAMGFFGFFECIDDQAVANALFDEAAAWLRAKGMTTLRGPVNPSTNYECGLLIDHFDVPPSVMMTYNPPYYIKLFEGYKLAKAKDLFAFDIDRRKGGFSDKLLAQAERLKERGKVTFRTVNMRDFDNEVARILEIYNDAWESNWGFVPMPEDEFRHMAKDMKLVVDPNLLLIAEVRGEIAGFALTLPDVNQAQIKIKDGKLLPFGIFKLLWNLKGPGRRKTINRCRILTLGIKKDYRNYAIGPLLYAEYYNRGPAAGYPVGEASWILEDNVAMVSAAQKMGGEKTKTYRIYERQI